MRKKREAEAVSLPVLTKAFQEEGIKVKPSEAFILKAQEAKVFLAKRTAGGGLRPRSLDQNISRLEQSLQESRRWMTRKVKQQSVAKANLTRMERAI